MRSRTELHLYALIDQFVAGEVALPEFWKQFTFAYADATEGEISEESASYFEEVNDRLHYTDWSAPAESMLTDPAEFATWLAQTHSARST